MKSNHRNKVIILDQDLAFLRAINFALHAQKTIELTDIEWKIVEDRAQLKDVSDREWTSIVIDSRFINAESMIFLHEVYQLNPDCRIILIVSNEGGATIKETIITLDALDDNLEIEFVLGDNLSVAMKVEQCIEYIKK